MQIDKLKNSLAVGDYYHLKAMVEYCRDNLGSALVFLQHAILHGIQKQDIADLEAAIRQELGESTEESSPAVEKNETHLPPDISTPDKPIVKQKKDSSEPEKVAQPKKLANEGKEHKRIGRTKLILSNTLPKVKQPHTLSISIDIEFLNENDEKAFVAFKQQNEKINEILEDIKSSKWYAASGVGKPEILKHLFKGHKGCISRRINHEARLVYKVTRKGKILILGLEGHYK